MALNVVSAFGLDANRPVGFFATKIHENFAKVPLAQKRFLLGEFSFWSDFCRRRIKTTEYTELHGNQSVQSVDKTKARKIWIPVLDWPEQNRFSPFWEQIPCFVWCLKALPWWIKSAVN